ncbi:hypothetical protein SK128_024335 [Halocaridina rubra]|uniref:Reverse transcriptase/retrotransposon-derived protein RNase H-like domain-containing protein n=1 Tax=Halocaridina rubra TaxID=373956 RepID=A0AAN8ZXV4_HALRR
MSYAGTGKWNAPRHSNTSSLSSPHMDISNTTEDTYSSRLLVTPSTSAVTWPLKTMPLPPNLMRPKRTFTWTEDHNEAFRWIKTALLRPLNLAPVVLQTDASQLYGTDYALLQDHGQG